MEPGPSPGAEHALEAALADELLDFVWRRIANADADLLRVARRRVLDTIGVMAAATRDVVSQSLLSEVGRWPSTSAQGATALTLQTRQDPATAALVNGFLANSIDFDDTFQAGIAHVGAIVVPTALAVGEMVQADAAEIDRAVLIGYEVACRISEPAAHSMYARGFHPTPVCGAFAAAAVAARLLNLVQPQRLHALTIAGSMAAGLLQFTQEACSLKGVHAGWAAHSGIVAARLAAGGVTGPTRVFEGRFGLYRTHADLERSVRGAVLEPARPWGVQAVTVKPYPCCQFAHAHIDAARALRTSCIDRLDDVAEIRCYAPAETLAFIAEPVDERWDPTTSVAAKMSLPFVVAAAIVDGHVRLETFGAERLRDDRLLTMMRRIRCMPDPDSAYPASFDGALEIEMTGGEILRQRVDASWGSPSCPMTESDLVTKYRTNLQSCAIKDETTVLLSEAMLDGDEIIDAFRRLNTVLSQ